MVYFLLLLFTGLTSGLLVNYLVIVLPLTRRLGYPSCTSCRQTLSIRNFILYRRCPSCGNLRSPLAYLVQGIYPIIFLLSGYTSALHVSMYYIAPLLIYFGVVLLIDIEYQVILFETIIPGVILALLTGLQQNPIRSVLIGGISGFFFMLLIYLLGFLFIHILSKIKRRMIDTTAIGFADVYFCFILGLLVGFPKIILVILIAIFSAGMISVIYVVFARVSNRYKPLSTFPYTPFLIIGTVVIQLI